MFANGPGGLGSIPGRVIPKTQKMVLDASLLNTQHYKVRIKGKVEQSREGVAPSPTPWCSSYRKGSLRDTLDYGRQLYLLINTIMSALVEIVVRNNKINQCHIEILENIDSDASKGVVLVWYQQIMCLQTIHIISINKLWHKITYRG